jgi:glycosyltransferase involved in cell wall biosynthesis
MITIGGNVSIRNGNSLDYCWKEAVESLLPVCDTVTICDGYSDDDTWQSVLELVAKNHKIKTIRYPWPPASIGTSEFWTDWLNFTRRCITEDYHLQLDGDEVLCPTAIPTLNWFRNTLNPGDRTVLQAERLNFWRDAQHLAPHGKLCGNRVIRFAPRDMWLPSDAPHPKAAEAMRLARNPDHTIFIFHYGFLRHRDAMFSKAAKCRHYFCGTQFINREDPRMAAVRNKAGNWMERIEGIPWINDLLPFTGHHPAQMHHWLIERGFTP